MTLQSVASTQSPRTSAPIDAKADAPLLPSSLFAVNSIDDMVVERLAIGGAPALLIDNVYRNPYAVRRFALSLQFQSRGYYPGGYAEVSIPPREMLALINRLLSAEIGRQLMPHPHYRGTTFGCIWTDPGDLEALQRQPHYDYFCDYAGLLHLGPCDGSGGGTTFWRHRKTGFMVAPSAIDDRFGPSEAEVAGAMQQMGVDSPEALDKSFFDNADSDLCDGYALSSTPVWSLEQKVESSFNRLIIFHSRVFHAPFVEGTPPLPGDFPRQRITQNFFLNYIDR